VDAQAQVQSKLDQEILICNRAGAPLPLDYGLDCGYQLTISPDARGIGSGAHGPQTTLAAGRVPSPGQNIYDMRTIVHMIDEQLPGRLGSFCLQVQQSAAVSDSLVAAENTQGRLS